MSAVRIITVTPDELRALIREEVEAAVSRSAPAEAPREIYISLAQASERTGRHADTLRRWIKEGRLRAKQGSPGETYRVRPEDLDAAMGGGATPAEPVDVDAAADLILRRRR